MTNKIQLKRIERAISEGRAYVETYLGEYQVRGYDAQSNWAYTGKGLSARSWRALPQDIIIKG